MLIGYKRGQGSIVLRVKILDSSVSTGAGKTGLTSASAGLIVSTIADNESAATAYTVAGSTIETITTLGTFAAPTATKCRFKEVDATNHKGVYEIQIADARYAVSSAKSLLVSISGATSGAETDVVIPLRDLDPFDSVRAGLTALPNAAAEAAGGLYTRGTGAGQIAQQANGQVDVNVSTIKTQTVTCAAGVTVLASVGTAATSTAQTGDNYARLGAPAGASHAADVAAVKVDTAAVKLQTDKLAFTVTNQVDSNVLDWKSATAPAMTGDAYARLGAPAGASVSADLAAVPTANANADALLDRTAGVETSWTLRQALRIMLASVAGKLSGGSTTTVAIRDVGDSKDRITATVDASGNRSAVSYDKT